MTDSSEFCYFWKKPIRLCQKDWKPNRKNSHIDANDNYLYNSRNWVDNILYLNKETNVPTFTQFFNFEIYSFYDKFLL